MISQQTTVKIATLNCCSLRKSDDTRKRQQAIRYFRTLGFDILVLQETHTTDNTTTDTFNIQFNSKSSLWNHDCGIISINHNYSLQHIPDGIDEGRLILVSLHLSQALEHPPTTPPTSTTSSIQMRKYCTFLSLQL